ncbi:MAG: hypothetical protein IPN09_16785 [Bacteroidetes bacterium]|nr:hypothetical protein [Bacteroidota bacterium]
MQELSELIILNLKKIEFKKEDIALLHQKNYKIWRTECEITRINFDKKLKELLEIHWQFSSKFLIQLELTKTINKHIIAWDSSRMVGWKLFEHLHQSGFTKIDLLSSIKDLYPDLQIEDKIEKKMLLLMVVYLQTMYIILLNQNQ